MKASWMKKATTSKSVSSLKKNRVWEEATGPRRIIGYIDGKLMIKDEAGLRPISLADSVEIIMAEEGNHAGGPIVYDIPAKIKWLEQVASSF